MNKNLTPYIYILFFLTLTQGIFAQDFTLKLVGKDSIETPILNQLDFQSKHATKKSVDQEIQLTKNKLQRLGYFTNQVVNISEEKKIITVQLYLGPKTEKIFILIPNTIQEKFRDLFFTSKDSISLKPSEVENYIESIVKTLDESGKSFTEVRLINPKLQTDSISFEISIQESQERTIDKVVIKGYENFPKAFIKKYFKITENSIFSKPALQEISTLTKSLSFVEEIKPPEVLFKQDSTIVYLFLKKLNSSSVDGIVNLASKDDGSGLLINGNLDLKLKNVLHTGEQFNLFWNRVKEGNSEFRINTLIPYIFNSSFSSELRFNIYRQDSTFLTTSFLGRVAYQVNQNSTAFLSYSSENSEYLLDETNLDFDTYSKYFFEIGYGYQIVSNDSKFNQTFSSQISLGFGQRSNDSGKESQGKVLFDAEMNISTSSRSYLNVKNSSGILESENFLTNELFRIGGANSIRGFNEQSIFTNRFSYLNVEYRYLTSLNSYLHSITDFGIYKNIPENSTDTVLGLGFGYLFSVDNNQINLGYALGIQPGKSFEFNQSKLIIRFTSTF